MKCLIIIEDDIIINTLNLIITDYPDIIIIDIDIDRQIKMKSELFKTAASTLQKIANLPRYRHPADLVNNFVRPVRQQRMEIDGKLQFGVNKYLTQLQQKLVKQLVKNRTTGYWKGTVEQRNRIADGEYESWKDYLNQRVTTLPQNLRLTGQKKQKLYEAYLASKQRNQQRMQLAKTVKLFYQLSLGFKFDIPIHPLVMMRMVNPHIGYLNNFKEHRLPFDDYIAFLEECVVASQQYSLGSTLHGAELLSFVFWKVNANKSTLSVQDFCKFLSYFKFNIKPENLNKQFEYHLRNREGQLKEGSSVRFDLWRNVFLQRGL